MWNQLSQLDCPRHRRTQQRRVNKTAPGIVVHNIRTAIPGIFYLQSHP